MRYLLAMVLLVVPGVVWANLPTKVDPLLRLRAGDFAAEPAVAPQWGLKAAADGSPLVDVLIKTTDPVELGTILDQWGGGIRTVAGEIVTANVPLDLIDDVAALDIVSYIEAAKPMAAKLNASRAVVNIDDVQAGTGLAQAYTGRGVIVGIVDAGIDCQHADFKDSNGTSRILAYWDQSISGSGVAEITNSSGKEYTGTGITNNTCATSAETDAGGHGTHVAGIATSRNSTYTGVATEATIVAVLNGSTDPNSGGNLSTQVVDAVNYIFRKAQAQSPKKPAVVNLSLGTSLGAHDDTSLLEQGLNALLQANGSDKQGRAIVNAAGNENFSSADSGAATFGGIHATVDVTSGAKAFDFLIRDSAKALVTFGGVTVDIWLASTSSCAVQIDAYPKSSKTSPLIDMNAVEKGGSTSSSANTDSRLKIALDFSDASNANNGKQHAVATITKVTGSTVDGTDYSFDLIFSGTCSGDAWLYPDQTAIVDFRKVSALPAATNSRGYSYVDGDSNRTMTIPGTASKVITVGSFMARGSWTDVNGSTHNQTATSEGTGGTASGISLFSSLGPTADARVKPDIAAPGEPIISTTASNVSVATTIKGDATHHKMEGSSMAAPHVTGTVALMLQRNGCLTPSQIKTALKDTAAKDSFTGASVPNNTWGAGKLDALAAVQAVSVSSCVPNNSTEDGAANSFGASTGSTTTSADGGGGCSLIK